MASNLYDISDNLKKEIRLPHDYQYSDAKPNDVVSPVSLDRKVKSSKNRREDFTKWLITQPDFSHTIANRVWYEIVGQPLLAPIDNFDINDSPEGKILQHLGQILRDSGYSLKTLIRHIVTSDFYSRVAYSGDMNEYRFQSVVLKRITSYQLWDSILTLVLDDPNYTRINFQEYSKLVELDFDKIDAQMLLDRVATIRAYDEELNKKFLKFKGIDLVRSCFLLSRTGFTGIFTKEFGSSDRTLVDASDNQGSISQVLLLMNSPLTELISSPESQLVRAYAKENKNKDIIFISIMGRLPTLAEKSIIASADEKDLIWSLVNSREFLFRK